MVKIDLKADVRKITGRKVKNLRKSGLVPANVYGKDVKSESIEINAKEFSEVFKKAGETSIVTLKVGKEDKPVLVHNVQIHPATDEVLHVDFLQVNLKEKITAQVPVELVGESPAEKSGIGTAVLLLQEVEVEALPTDLPEKFEIDATKLTEVDQTVKVADLKVSDGVEIKTDGESVVAKVEPPQKEEVVETTPIEGEAPAEGESSAEGGEQPTEGQTETEASKDQA
jgi:large subunit ribosomal protein L25